MQEQSVLIIHNYYRNKGGEDMVVLHETEALKRTGAKVYELHYHNPPSGHGPSRLLRFFSGVFFNLHAYWEVYQLVKRNGIRVVHIHNVFYRASPGVFWAARHAGARVVATLHNYRLFCLNAMFYRSGKECMACHEQRSFRKGISHGCFRGSRVQSFFLAASLKLHQRLGSWHKAVDKFIVINPQMQAYLQDLGIDAGKIYYKPNCIEDRSCNGYQERSDYYLLAGRLEPEKGIATILDAWNTMNLPLHIAGTGSLRQLVVAAAGNAVQYLGHIDQHSMQQELAGCRALLFASQWKEGMPLSLIEAMASGVICIARSSAVTRLLIQDGVSGLLFSDDDGAGTSLLAAVARMEAMSLAEREAMSQAARRFYEQHCSMNQHLRHIAAVYELPLQWQAEYNIPDPTGKQTVPVGV